MAQVGESMGGVTSSFPACKTSPRSRPLRPTALRTVPGLACVVLFGSAILIGRANPRLAPTRHEGPPRYHPVYHTSSSLTRAALLDTETGAVHPRSLSLPGQRIAYPSCSPWRDDSEGSQIVATWWEAGPTTGDGERGGCGLVRFSFPDGSMLDRIPCWPVPASPAAWLPGHTARIVFAAGDGNLYRSDLESDDGPPPETRRKAAVPLALDWACPRPGGKLSHFSDIHCPVGMAGGTWIISTVIGHEFETDPRRPLVTHLCWLRLDPSGSEVIAAGLLALDSPDDPEFETPILAHPRIAVGRVGCGTLLYLTRRERHGDWLLKASPIEYDPSNDGLKVRVGETTSLANGVLLSPPGFSADSRWIFASVIGGDGSRVRRFFNPFPDSSRDSAVAKGKWPDLPDARLLDQIVFGIQEL
jgi:hypothetical protein